MASRRMKFLSPLTQGAHSPFRVAFLSAGFMASLGATTALAVCATPATQVTGGAVTESGSVNFQNWGTGTGSRNVTIGGLTLNCTIPVTGTTQAVATFFANLANNSTGGAAPGNCSKTGTLTGWTSGAASGSLANWTTVFTSTTANSNVTDLAVTVSGTATTVTATNTETQGSAGSVAAVVSGKTVCVGASGARTNQEYHDPNGNITDWKKGAADPKDPTKTIGTWSISGNNIVYTYTAGSTGTYSLWLQSGGTSYDWCNGATTVVNVTTANILPGQVACN